MTITGEKLNSWIEGMSELASNLMRNFEAGYGYEPGENGLVEAASERGRDVPQALSNAGVPGELVGFYERVERVSLPDVGNGLFVHSADDVVDGVEGEQPTEVTGSVNDSIIIFGSDGGGGLFALSTSGGKVYRLSGGSLIGSTYDVDDSGVKVIENGFWGFLEYLRRELAQAIPGDR